MAVIDFPNTPIVGATFSIPGGANYRYDGVAWVKVDPVAEAQAIPFHTLKGYVAKDLVVKDGHVYRCKANIPAHAFVAAEWEEVGAVPVPPGVETFDPTKNYAANALVAHQGEIYFAPTGGATAGPFDGTKWHDLVLEPAIHVFSTLDQYSAGALVVYNTKIYRCLSAITVPGPWAAAKWEEVVGAASVTTAETPPADPKAGNLWWKSDEGQLYVYYTDANSSQWVQAGPTPTLDPSIYALKAEIADMAKLSVAQNWKATQSYPVVALTYGANVAWPLATAQKASLTLTGNATMTAPAGSKSGSSYWLFATSSGGTLSFDLTGFDFGTAGAPTLSGGGKTDILMFECRADGGKLMFLGAAKGFA